MKRVLFACMFGLLIFGSNAAFAELKIGIVDMQKLIKQDAMVQTWRSKIADKFKLRNKKMVALRNALLKNINKLKKLPSANVTTRKKIKTKITVQAKRLRALQVALKNDLLGEQRKAVAAITKKIQVAIEKVALRKKIDVVLKRSSLMYCCEMRHALNITPACHKVLNGR